MKIIGILICLLLCSGCWDMKEINQLAIVNLGAADKDPETGRITAYYQVINPSALTNKQSGAAKAAVYTFKFEDFSLGRFTRQTTTIMPRSLFMPHMQALILSERYAKQGITDMINFVELSPDRRTNVIFLIAGSPIETIINSFSPLERMPGRYIRSLINLSGQGFETGYEPIRIKDLAKGMYRKKPMVIPIVSYTSSEPAKDTNRLEDIDIRKKTFLFVGGAVFRHGRMVGRLNFDEKQRYFLLNKNLTNYIETLTVNGDYVDVEASHIRVRRKFNASGLTYRIRATLRIVNNQQTTPVTRGNIRDIEDKFNRQFEAESQAFVRMAANKDWDLLGIQDRGIRDWKHVKVTFKVESDMSAIGNTTGPHTFERGN
ncbi:Ger(x)C family spore germination protein [Paenibacillus glycinis]|uniref:Ger(X)C family spore germination protein n=1 Tax=Paenibacillus glycinis TaxID=2697035 RepID=A0ABW9XM36_9BACL|nr:Ger(x)C family spore germination C-terminal domain-containing protein [Paenibacillus glycinis]NBD23692.1 hypothetical protein [Paenibacillus glycinis]